MCECISLLVHIMYLYMYVYSDIHTVHKTHTHNTLGLLSSIPSHTPLAKSVVPMYFTTPKSAPLTNTFIPVSSVTLGREERESVEEESEV